MDGKIYAGILLGKVRRVVGGLISGVQVGFRAVCRSDFHPKVDK